MNKRLALEALVLVALTFSVAISFPLTEALEGSWVSLTPLPSALSGCKAAVVDGRIYVFGASVTYAYNPETDTWSTKTPMPTSRLYFGAAAFEGKIYVIGGRLAPSNINNIQMTGKNEAYNPATDTWETKATMPIPTESADANAAAGSIYVAGGLKDPLIGEASNINQAYNPVNNSWSLKASLPTAIFTYASTVLDGKIYILGGDAKDNPGTQNQIYDPQTDSWTTGPGMPGHTDAAGAAATSGLKAPKRLYVVGGRLSHGYESTNAMQIFDPSTGTWDSAARMRTARQRLAVVAVDDKIYAIGGTYPEIQGTSSTSGKPTLTLVSKVTPVNFMPYLDTAANERYTPSGYSETPSESPSPTATATHSPNPTQSPTTAPTSPATTLTPSPDATATTPQETNPPLSTPTPPNQQTPTPALPESGSPFEALTPGWLALIAVLVVGLPLSALLIRRSRKR
jgi:N-acetylneuraminic acid mutarotase